MSASTKPVLPCEKLEVVKINLTPAKGAGLDNDFIPIIELDKSYQEKGFKYIGSNSNTSLSAYIEKRDYPLEAIKFQGEKEIVLRFTVNKGNSAANDNEGNVHAIGHGVKIISKTELNVKYGFKILLRISSEELVNNAFIDFYANDDDWYYYDKQHVHCGRIIISSNSSIIFPFLIKPLNDKGSTIYPNRYWAAAINSNSATYGSSRSNGTRKHAGRDLYAKDSETIIVAICDGIVLDNSNFYNSTNQLVILHTTIDGRKFIIRYGEIAPSSVKVKKNDQVYQGQEIARVGKLTPAVTIDNKVTNMLHFEYFTGVKGYDLKSGLTQSGANKYQRREDIADPLPILQEGYNNTFGQNTNEGNRKSVESLSISDNGVNFIKSWEGCKLNSNKTKLIAYDDSEGYATIGYGHLIAKKKCNSLTFTTGTIISGISKVEFEDGITENRAIELLKSDLKKAEVAVKKDITVPLFQHEYDALVSLVFNTGAAFLSTKGAGGGDTKIKKNINNKKYEEGANEFSDVTNGGVTGLVNRRQAEIKMFKNGVYENNS